MPARGRAQQQVQLKQQVARPEGCTSPRVILPDGKGATVTQPETGTNYSKGNGANGVAVRTLLGEYVEEDGNHERKVIKKVGWSLHADLPFRAFENALGVQAPVDLWAPHWVHQRKGAPMPSTDAAGSKPRMAAAQ